MLTRVDSSQVLDRNKYRLLPYQLNEQLPVSYAVYPFDRSKIALIYSNKEYYTISRGEFEQSYIDDIENPYICLCRIYFKNQFFSFFTNIKDIQQPYFTYEYQETKDDNSIIEMDAQQSRFDGFILTDDSICITFDNVHKLQLTYLGNLIVKPYRRSHK